MVVKGNDSHRDLGRERPERLYIGYIHVKRPVIVGDNRPDVNNFRNICVAEVAGVGIIAVSAQYHNVRGENGALR